MTMRNTHAMSVRDFEHLLEVYGADRTRWPIAARAAAAACLAADQEARRLLTEAKALDAVLMHAEEPHKTDIGALVERIVAATKEVSRPAVVASHPVAAANSSVDGSLAVSRPIIAKKDWMRGAALLAASLVIGIFVGQSQLGARAVPALEDLTGMSASATSAERLAMLDLHIEAVDED